MKPSYSEQVSSVLALCLWHLLDQRDSRLLAVADGGQHNSQKLKVSKTRVVSALLDFQT